MKNFSKNWMKNHRARKFRIESLEDRMLLAVTAGLVQMNAAVEETGQTNWVVNTIEDPSSWSKTDSEISLREAIGRAESRDTITFDSSLANKTICLNGKYLQVKTGITIDASSIGGMTIDAVEKNKVFYINGGTEKAPVTFIDLTITGGKYCGIEVSSSTVTLMNCSITENSSSSSGGGICAFSSTVTLTNCSIADNNANSNGGGIYASSSTFKLTDCTASENISKYQGGGIYILSNTSMNLTRCTVSENSSGFGSGGGIATDSGTVTLTNCEISKNSARKGGGGINTGNGIYTLINCLISENSSESNGGGIYTDGSNVTLTNCTIAKNSADYYSGGGIYMWTATKITAYNTIVAQNTASSDNDIHIHKGSGSFKAYNTLSSFTNWTEKTKTYVYDSSLPLFTDPDKGDYTLAQNSQAIDKGNNAYIDGYKVDLAGNSRIVNGTVDLGAYEKLGSKQKLSTPTITEPTYNQSNSTVTVEWNAVSNAEKYVLAYAIAGQSFTEVEVTGTSKSISVSPGTSYQFKVKAVAANYYDSDYSSIVNFTTTAKLSTPTISKTTYNQSNSTVTVEWNAVSNAEKYVLAYAVAGQSFTEVQVTDTSKSISVSPGTSYQFKVKAVASNYDDSNYSAIQGYTVPAGPSREPESTIVTTNLDIEDPTDNLISLREAIQYADVGGTVTFDVSLSGQTIILNGPEIVIDKSLTIDAVSIGNITIDANNQSRVFNIRAAGKTEQTVISLNNLTITGGNANIGGGILIEDASVNLTSCTVTENSASESGGGIYGAKTITTLYGCKISGNTADAGGGIYMVENSALSVTYSTVSRNSAVTAGGCIYTQDCSEFRLINSKVVENKASEGGGIYTDGNTVTLSNSTISRNSANFGGGICVSVDDAQTQLCSYNTIIAENTGADNDSDIAISGSGGSFAAHNTLSSFTNWSKGSKSNYVYDQSLPLFADPDSGNYSLADHSQAIDKGNNAYVDRSTIYDLDGNARIVNGTVDLGAYEKQDQAVSTRITISTSLPTVTETDCLESVTAASLNDTLYVSVWIKSNNSNYGVEGGYCSLYFSEGAKPDEYIASPLYNDSIAVGMDEGHITGFGGFPAEIGKAYGADKWVLAGTYQFSAAQVGTLTFHTDAATKKGVEKKSWNFMLQNGENTNSYNAASVTIYENFETPVILTGDQDHFVSYGANRHRLEWTAVDGASSYELAYLEDGHSWTTIATSKTAAVVTGLTYGSVIYYRVRALNPGVGAWSEIKSFTVCPMDINNDGDVAVADRVLLGDAWLAEIGGDKYRYYADIDADGNISSTDRSFLAANWLKTVGEDKMTYPAPKEADFVFDDFSSLESGIFEDFFGDF